MGFLTAHLCILVTILLSVYINLVIKWQMLQVTGSAQFIWMKIVYQFLNPWILSAFGAAFLAAFCWMAAMTKLNLSYAYPFMSISFVLTILLSGLIFHEPISVHKIIGAIFIVIGIIVATRTY